MSYKKYTVNSLEELMCINSHLVDLGCVHLYGHPVENSGDHTLHTEGDEFPMHVIQYDNGVCATGPIGSPISPDPAFVTADVSEKVYKSLQMYASILMMTAPEDKKDSDLYKNCEDLESTLWEDLQDFDGGKLIPVRLVEILSFLSSSL